MCHSKLTFSLNMAWNHLASRKGGGGVNRFGLWMLSEGQHNLDGFTAVFTFMLWRRKWQPTPVFLPGESQGRGAWWAAVYGVAQSRTRLKGLSMHACIGEGNGNPFQCSCLENPRDGGAWWAAVYGVAQSRTRLKRLSSSNCYLNWGL